MNCTLALVLTEEVAGEIETPVTVGEAVAVTLTGAEPDTLESAALVAVTKSLPALEGAVYSPAAVILPS